MRIPKLHMLTAFVVVASAVPAAGQTGPAWLCITDQSTGFTNESGSGWRAADFKAGRRYLIKRGNREGVAWEVREFGDASPIPAAVCSEDFTELKVLSCRGILTEFKFNGASGRFLRTYIGGYWTYTPNHEFFGSDSGDTPILEIGTCSSL